MDYTIRKANPEDMTRILEIYAYARLQQDADNTDQHMQALSVEAEALAAEFINTNSFIEPEILALDKEKLAEMLATEPALSNYKYYIENLVRLADHILPAQMEELLAQSRLATGSASTAFRSLVSADMEFPKITDGNGNEATVSEGNYLLNMTSPDRELRKNSFQGLMGTYHKYRNTLASTLTGSCRSANFYATAHKYPDTLTASLAADNIPTSLYDGLIQTVHDNLAPLHEYMQLKKDVLGFEELHTYDIYVPLSNAGDSFACDFDEACEKIVDALQPLGEKYIATLKKGFSEGWIDIYENKGKRSGAYSWGVYGVHPFVLLNYQKRYNSISTIAHEMGHALHSYFSSSAQTYINADYTIFCAEVASTTNEILLLEHTLKHANDEQKIYLLNQFLEAVRTTVYRQVQFAEFEKFIHGEITAGRTLQAEKLENYWLDSNKRYYGEALTVDKELASEWSRIPHFYTPFYVYKYATGIISAISIVKRILTEGESAVKDYFAFLSSGGCQDPVSILKKAGVDLTTKAPFETAMKEFETTLEEFEKLL